MQQSQTWRWAVLVLLVALPGCSGSLSGVIRPLSPETDEQPAVYVLSGEVQPKKVEAIDPKAGQATKKSVEPEDFIEPGDQLEVVVRRGAGEEKYLAVVRANGEINVSFTVVNVRGLSEFEAEERINEKLAKVIRNPYTQVRVAQKGSSRRKYYYIIGELKKPGRHEWLRGVTLLTAISAGESFTDVAALDRVVLISKRPGQEQPLVRVANLQRTLITGDMSADLPVQENDIVFVPRSGAGDFYNYYSKVAAPIINSVLGAVNGVFIGKALDAAWRVPPDTQPAVPVCWVAGVLYGDHAWQTHLLRWYIVGPLSDHWAGRAFADLYRAYGRQVARVLERHPRLQALVRPLFDQLLKQALVAAETGMPKASLPSGPAARQGL
ncbi:MAG: polysaccharide biosynthesis/export family protein [Nitrospirota bacterium]|nr:polysaccharide biosynthesis/export family protein [Nitrospirota bacterium]